MGLLSRLTKSKEGALRYVAAQSSEGMSQAIARLEGWHTYKPELVLMAALVRSEGRLIVRRASAAIRDDTPAGGVLRGLDTLDTQLSPPLALSDAEEASYQNALGDVLIEYFGEFRDWGRVRAYLSRMNLVWSIPDLVADAHMFAQRKSQQKELLVALTKLEKPILRWCRVVGAGTAPEALVRAAAGGLVPVEMDAVADEVREELLTTLQECGVDLG